MALTVCNTSPIQYLFQAGVLELLPSLYGELTIPKAVVSEIAEGRRSGVDLPKIEALPWVRVQRARGRTLLPILADLGPGEREVLALAVETTGALAILDDGLARRYASHLGVRIIGTLGILLLAKERSHLPAVAPVLDQLTAFDFGSVPLPEVLS